MSLIYAILIFGFIVFIHEFGHFIFAVKSGIFVEEFAIGMGKKIYSFHRNGTEFSIRLLPLGGFCKMLGEDEDNQDERAFNNKSVLARMGVIIAGSLFNIILALVIFIAFSLVNGYATTTVGDIAENSFAYEYNLQPGDKVVKINENKTSTFNDILFSLATLESPYVEIKYIRDGEKETVSGDLLQTEKGNYYIGFTPEVKSGLFSADIEGIEKTTILESVSQGLKEIFFTIESTLKSLGMLFSQTIGVDQMAGPVGIVDAIDDTYSKSSEYGFKSVIMNMLSIMALLSANLAVFNMLPFPALDGGRFVFLIVEGISGRPISPRIEGFIHLLGFAILITFALFVTFNDILRLF